MYTHIVIHEEPTMTLTFKFNSLGLSAGQMDFRVEGMYEPCITC